MPDLAKSSTECKCHRKKNRKCISWRDLLLSNTLMTEEENNPSSSFHRNSWREGHYHQNQRAGGGYCGIPWYGEWVVQRTRKGTCPKRQRLKEKAPQTCSSQRQRCTTLHWRASHLTWASAWEERPGCPLWSAKQLTHRCWINSWGVNEGGLATESRCVSTESGT